MRNNEKTRQEVTALLSKLQLWSNDPGIAEEIRPFAEEGNHHAQYALGLVYAEGRGVEQSNKLAYHWLNRACGQGDQDACMLLDFIKLSMTPDDILEAEKILSNGVMH